MKENISYETRKAVEEFRNMEESKQLYTMSILINHCCNGLINDGNYSDSDNAYENNHDVIINIKHILNKMLLKVINNKIMDSKKIGRLNRLLLCSGEIVATF